MTGADPSEAVSVTLAEFEELDIDLLRSVLDVAPVGATLLDCDMRFRWVNSQFPTVADLPVDVHSGRTPVELYGPSAETAMDLLRESLRTGQPTEKPFAALDHDGFDRFVDRYVIPLKTPAGAVAGLLAFAVERENRAELLRAQSELRRAAGDDRARLEAVFTHAPVGMAVVDPDGYALMYSQAVVELFGEPAIDDEGRARFDAFTPRDDELVGGLPILRTLHQGITVPPQTVQVVAPGGRRVTVLASSAPVFQRGGALRFAVLCFTDVSELQEARRSLQASRRRVQAAAARLGRVHELTTELARARSLDQVLTAVARFVEADLGAVRARLALVEGPPQALSVRAAEAEAGGGSLRVHFDRDALAANYPELATQVGVDEAAMWVSLPLASSGRALGVYLIGWKEPWPLTDDDRAGLEMLARQAAVALDRILLDEQQRTVVETLQVALLPRVLPQVPALTLMARYRPSGDSSSVGGDWFDAVRTPRGLVLSVGDVAGHGMSSAAMMAQLRSAARAYAVEGHDPAHVLGLLDGLLADRREDVITSAVIAEVDLQADTLRWACAGHPPPLLALGDGVKLLEGANGRVLGLGGATYRAEERPFPPGAGLMLYTDGLVERRNATIGSGIAELCSRLEAGFPADNESLDRLIDEMVAHSRQNDDDLCVLLACRTVPD